MIMQFRTVVRTGLYTLIWISLAHTAAAGPMELLPGRWSGWGDVTLDGGAREKIKCVATYFSEADGRQLKHSLRCASPSYTIDAVANLNVDGSKVSGSWKERKYDAGGTVSGRVANGGLRVDIVGGAFRATLNVETTKCHQSMAIAPNGLGISRIDVKLAKC